mgnify:FL=1
MTQIYIKPQLNKMLYAMLGSWDLVDRWWHSSNKAFDGVTPNEIYWADEAGRQRVAGYIISFVSGDYS